MSDVRLTDKTREPRRRKAGVRPKAAPASFQTSLSVEERRILVSDRPITFDQWIDRGGRRLYELVHGSLVEKRAAQLEHERLFMWLATLLNLYVSQRGLGEVLGSRTAVRITEFDGRLPDIVFVGKQRSDIVRAKGIYAGSDLIIEIRSPGDKPSEITALESEYRTIGTRELWFIDPERKRMRVLRRFEESYEESTITSGPLNSHVVEGFTIQAEWLWDDSRPDVAQLLKQISPN